MTVVMGLHGLQIEKQAAEIRQNLKKLNADFAAFRFGCWDTFWADTCETPATSTTKATRN